MNKALEHVVKQIHAAKSALEELDPREMDWHARSLHAVKTLTPWLIDTAPQLKQHVEEVLNSPHLLRKKWDDIKSYFHGNKKDIALMERYLSEENLLLEHIPGNVVSSVVEQFLINSHPQKALSSNGKSDYPDLYLNKNDYSNLPASSRSGSYGASIKGNRPVRIPDGLELKTCKKRFSVDCHYPHIGLHLVLIFGKDEGIAHVDDIMVAYLTSSDYREAGRKTRATTVKYSFNGRRFISILTKH